MNTCTLYSSVTSLPITMTCSVWANLKLGERMGQQVTQHSSRGARLSQRWLPHDQDLQHSMWQ